MPSARRRSAASLRRSPSSGTKAAATASNSVASASRKPSIWTSDREQRGPPPRWEKAKQPMGEEISVASADAAWAAASAAASSARRIRRRWIMAMTRMSTAASKATIALGSVANPAIRSWPVIPMPPRAPAKTGIRIRTTAAIFAFGLISLLVLFGRPCSPVAVRLGQTVRQKQVNQRDGLDRPIAPGTRAPHGGTDPPNPVPAQPHDRVSNGTLRVCRARPGQRRCSRPVSASAC